MKIIVFHQPHPSGNYLLNEVVANKLTEWGHEVYLLQQLHGSPIFPGYLESIQEAKPDLVYFEMLDENTFKVIEKIKTKKILVYTSNGILGDYKLLLNKRKWFDAILTNSVEVYKFCQKNKIPAEHFKFYHSVIPYSKDIPEKKLNCVFLGMGFGRLTDPSYSIEKSIFFNFPYDMEYSIFGSGWPSDIHEYKGILRPDGIETLYNSAISSAAIIATGQRKLGMINNRYVEIIMGKSVPISYRYDIDWFGLDEYVEFVDSKQVFKEAVLKSKLIYDTDRDQYNSRILKALDFMNSESNIFYEKLKSLL